MTTIYIIRHGQSKSNLDKTFAGQTDVPLTELGIKQAEISALKFRDFRFDKIYSSTLSRAYNTALPFAKQRGMDITQVLELSETSLGDWEGKRIDDVRSGYEKWKSDVDYVVPNGESYRMMMLRVGKAIDKIAEENPDKVLLVVSHGGCIRALPAYFDNCNVELIYKTPIPSNLSVTKVVYENAKGRIEQYAYDEYLGDMITQFDNGN